MKPGIKTSELYTSQGSAAALFGLVISEHDWRVKCAALLAIGFVQAAYALSRGLEKYAAAGGEE